MLNLPPEKEFALRTQLQTIEGLSRDQLVELSQDLMRQLVLKDVVVAEMIRKKLL